MEHDVLFREYTAEHSWQYDIRLKNRAEDLYNAGLTETDAEQITVNDFRFTPLHTETSRDHAIEFIRRHEWLGNISQYTTHWFGAYYQPSDHIFSRPILAGVILMNMPNAFSTMLGENTKQLERLISRGACISWSPKNLASALLMYSIRHMVKHTQYRLFTAYADPSARELGTIYQACNFYYLGKIAGTTVRCINPYTGKYVNDRYFRSRTAFKRYARDLGIRWESDWSNEQSIIWDNIPEPVKLQLRAYEKMQYANAPKIEVPLKHKYAYVLGANARETKRLRAEFETRNKIHEYPKERGN